MLGQRCASRDGAGDDDAIGFSFVEHLCEVGEGPAGVDPGRVEVGVISTKGLETRGTSDGLEEPGRGIFGSTDEGQARW